MKKLIREWYLYKRMKVFWVIYTPAYYCGGMYPKESYLAKEGGWTNDLSEAKRFFKHQVTINYYTRSKKMTL